jgi:hypothetical protein
MFQCHVLKRSYMFRPYWTIFRQYRIKNEIYCTVRLSVDRVQIDFCYYYRIYVSSYLFMLRLRLHCVLVEPAT